MAVYLHFLDRELWGAAAGRLPAEDAIKVLRTLALLTDDVLYCGLSALWENDSLPTWALDELEALMLFDRLTTISSDATQSEFLEHRRVAYAHDAHRYPRYFEEDRSIQWAVPTYQRKSGSTGPLSTSLWSWADSNSSGVQSSSIIIPRFAAAEPIKAGLNQRDGRAITFSLFEPYIRDNKSSVQVAANIRRQISRSFTSGYLDELNGDIVTGITQLGHFDNMSRTFPIYDVQLLGMLLDYCSLSDVVDRQDTDFDAWVHWLGFRQASCSTMVPAKVRWILRAFRPVVPHSDFGTLFNHRVEIRDTLLRAMRRGAVAPSSPVDNLEQRWQSAEARLDWLAQSITELNKDVGIKLEMARSDFSMTRADVVLMTVNDIETAAIRSALESRGLTGQIHNGRTNVYWLYGPVGNATVALLRSSMGSGGPGGSGLTARDAVEDVNAGALISIGVAFAMDEKQPIGQVLISERLATYELSKIGTAESGQKIVVNRGSEAYGATRLLSRFRDSRLEDIGIEVKTGLILSGEKLLDNREFRDELKSRYPEAIGGEMEGSGILSTGSRENVEWLVVKAVCDYAHNKGKDKDERQQVAAKACARAVLHVLEQGGLPRRT
ncbi:hypothetical protein AB0K11_05475 [Mycobacterium sp. NPDC050551]|uniref:5'-methylthioadenosine/S-adenosylhomocysteine nucleosidase family protein n=1 Tax=Mycobacterium sp. NPDC050551 TaxID=3155407 RepID=UPI0034234C33